MYQENIVLLSINNTYKYKMSKEELYEATNFAWQISEDKRKTLKYAFAIYRGIVKEVYKIKQWVPAIEKIPTTRALPENSKYNDKFAFVGDVAYNIRAKIINKQSFKRLYSAFCYGNFNEAKKFYELNNINNDTFLSDIKNIIGTNVNLNTEQENLVKCRIGQGSFREKLVEYWNGCSVTQFKQIEILVASHIKPWKDSNDKERLDYFNGLLLIPNLDKVFDKGYISFNDNGSILISKELTNYEILGIKKTMRINLENKHIKYLKFHRNNIFKGNGQDKSKC